MGIKWWVYQSVSIKLKRITFCLVSYLFGHFSILATNSFCQRTSSVEELSILYFISNRDKSEEKKHTSEKPQSLCLSCFPLFTSFCTFCWALWRRTSSRDQKFDFHSMEKKEWWKKKNKFNYRRLWEGHGMHGGSRVLPMNPGQETQVSLI